VKPTPEDIARATQILEALVEDRAAMGALDKEARQKLMMAAGKLSRPFRKDSRRENKALERRLKAEKEEQNREARGSTLIRQIRAAPVFPTALPGPAPDEPERILATPKHCYVCKQAFVRVHFFYDAMCPDCAAFNWQKRSQTADCRGRVALVTGGRLKIGQQAVLKLLRAGATVIATTRFPHDAAKRYASEPDFEDWRDRLHVHGLDLRHAPSVEIFARYVDATFPQLDLLVNNAAQTVRRPTGFYAHLLPTESEAPPPPARALLRSHEELKGRISGHVPQLGESPTLTGLALPTGSPAMGVLASAALSQVPAVWDDVTSGRDVFPPDRYDQDLQQVDLRTMNSWRMTLADVPSAEMIEVQLVNSVAPFVLCARLKPAMLRNNTMDRHVVNVSAMEGVFSRGTKTDKHPHTNMAKAALNMMTLTSAPDYAKDGIWMNAVDTGWVTDEDPAHTVERKIREHDFQPPLDIVDGAARVLDPFFVGLNTGEHVSGKFLKDYAPSSW
jgi:NAD(P)-dependent dehydrogenase (short-subunit alcohol dehydrogenase family)